MDFYRKVTVSLSKVLLKKVALKKVALKSHRLSALSLAVMALATSGVSMAAANAKETERSLAFSSELTEQNWLNRRISGVGVCPLSINEESINPIQSLWPLPAEQALSLTSETAKQTDGQHIVLSGDVRLLSAKSQLAAGQMSYNPQSETFSASDRILVETEQSLLQADSAKGNSQSQQMTLSNAAFRVKQHGANGQAKEISLGDNKLVMTQLDFSTCPQGNNSWRFFAEELEIDHESGWGEAKDLTLKIGDVPVLYLPWLQFPINDERHTGILPPDISYSSRLGLEFAQPIYLNLAPNYDATLTPKYMEERGFQLISEWRYLGDGHINQLDLEWLDDRKVQDAESSRWLYRLDHQGQSDLGWYSKIDASGVSDDFYFQDLGGSLNDVGQNHLLRHGEFGFADNQLRTSIFWQRYQSLTAGDVPYRVMPQWNLLWRPLGASDAFEWQLLAQYSEFEHPDPTRLQATREVLHNRFSVRWASQWGFLEPSVKTRYQQYQQGLSGDPEQSYSVSIPTYAIDSGLTFVRALESGEQTLEPRLQLLYTPYKDQSMLGVYDSLIPEWTFNQLFADNRFSGFDRISDQQRVSLGVTSRWLSGETGLETMRLSVGQAWYQQAPRVEINATLSGNQEYWINDDNRSNLVAEWSWHPGNAVSVSADLSFDHDRKETESGRIVVQSEPSENLMVNFVHRFRDSERGFSEQSQLALLWELNENWQWLAHWNRDIANQRDLESLFGVEYGSCCWKIRLAARRYLNVRFDQNGGIIDPLFNQYANDFTIQFEFVGLGGGQNRSLGQFLKSSVSGFRPTQ